MKKPNLLFVFSDQHRYKDLGCCGNRQVQTPNFDRFAEYALKVNSCISNSPVCVPARGSLLTGLFPQKHGAFTNDLQINYNVTSVADVLNKEGYQTGYIGKWHLCGIPREQSIPREKRLGFSYWRVANCNHDYLNCYYDDEENKRHAVEGYEPELFGRLGLDFLTQQTKGQPWALFLSFSTPHTPHTIIKQEYRDLYKDTKIQLPENVPDQIMISKEKFMTKKEQMEQAKGYYGHISAIDRQFGLLLAKLKETGQLDDTIVVYTSDHGEMLGSHGFTDKQLPYEESIRVPLLVYYKDHTITGETDEMIGLVDLPVTLLGLMGLSFPDETDGLNLKDLFTKKGAKGLESAYLFDLYPCHNAYRKGLTEWRAIRTKKYTYALTAGKENYLLFDHEKDPLQQNNLAHLAAYEPVKKELKEALLKYISKHDAFLSGDDYIISSGKLDEFNKSQIHFGLPPIQKR